MERWQGRARDETMTAEAVKEGGSDARREMTDAIFDAVQRVKECCVWLFMRSCCDNHQHENT